TPTQCNCRQDVILTSYLQIRGNRAYATFHNNSTTCSHLVGVASYMRPDDNIDDQVLYDFEQYNLAPGETRELSAAVPPCSYQIDAFCGEVIRDFHGHRYGDRLFDDIEGGTPYCQVTPTVTRTPEVTRTQPPVPYTNNPTK